MVRDLRRLADTRFDVLVIGAGIYGAITACDAARRGLSVALIDRGDVGGGTSFNNLKTLHGGLRSLQALNLRQMRRFIRERRAFARIAPGLVRPLPFVVPTTRDRTRNRLVMAMALAINDLVANDRDEGLADPALHLPRGRVVSRREALDLNPLVSPDGVTGAAVWYDYQMTRSDRMTFAFVLSAAAAGAVAANYVSAVTPILDGGRVAGMHVEDRLSGSTFPLAAHVVVNAAGAWAPGLLAGLPGGPGAVPAARLSRAMNVVVGPQAATAACGGLVDGRYLFLVPWRGVAILGTSHDAYEGTPDALAVSARDLEAFLDEGRRAFPNASLGTGDVRLVHRGLLPMVSGHGSHVELLRESTVIDHARHGAPGLVSIHGVRYTTARHTAEQAVDAVFHTLGYGAPPICRTAVTPLVGGEHRAPDADAAPAGVPLAAGLAVTDADIRYAAAHEMAMRLSDALLRRTEAGSAGHPGRDAVASAAAVMQDVHGWTQETTDAEIADVEAFYRLS